MYWRMDDKLEPVSNKRTNAPFWEESRTRASLSQISHFLLYSLRGPKMQLEKGVLIVSIDVDVGSSKLGIMNRGKNDANINNRISEYQIGKLEETAFPLFVETFNNFEIPVTFAIRGQLTEVPNSIMELLLESSVKHDIGAHGYYHKKFTNLSCNEAENELKKISSGLKKFGIIPRSFVFPRNNVAHLNLLEKYGYKCYRSYSDLANDCMYIEKQGHLYDIHPSLCIDKFANLSLLKKILDISTAKRLPFHVWFHLWNFGGTSESIQRSIEKVFFPLFKYAKRKEESGILSFETMLSATSLS
jgi:hypothetical protein